MSAKKWIFILLMLIVVSLVGFGGMNYYLDPMLQYGNEKAPLTHYEYAEMYANPGIAKNYDYDAVMVGTSMIENTNVDLCDELWNVDMVRLPYSGGTSYNMKTILEVAFQHNKHIKNVYWELDEFQLFGSATEPRYPLPVYLYDNNKYNDLKYLLNLDIFYHYTLKNIVYSLKGSVQPLERRGITLDGNFSAKQVLSTYSRPEQSKSILDFENSSMKNKLEANLKNIFDMINNHPDTEFTFFMPPFSVLYWDRELREGSFEAKMDGVTMALEEMLSCENVRVFFFHDEQEIISDLDNYKDYSHYGEWINNMITEYISDGRGILTKDNYHEKIDAFKKYIYEFDYERLLGE